MEEGDVTDEIGVVVPVVSVVIEAAVGDEIVEVLVKLAIFAVEVYELA